MEFALTVVNASILSKTKDLPEMKLDIMTKSDKSLLPTETTPDCQNQSQTQFLDNLKLEFTNSKVSKNVIDIIGSPITSLPFDAQIEKMLEWGITYESKVVCVANVHMLTEAYWNPEFSEVLKSADLVTPDGMPLVWMMKLMGARAQNRVAGMDILLSLCQLAPQRNISIFFLGSEATILEKMRTKLEHQFPNLRIAGMEPLPFRPLTPAEDDAVIQKIHESGAELVLVSLGCPKQEYWMNQHKGKIQAVMIGLGGVFPVFAGVHKWAPLWIREAGLEWFYRLIQEPRRLSSRYMNTIPPFIWLALKQLLTLKLKKQYLSSAQLLEECSVQARWQMNAKLTDLPKQQTRERVLRTCGSFLDPYASDSVRGVKPAEARLFLSNEVKALRKHFD